MADIIKLIRDKYPELSSAKKSAASYFLNNYTSLQFATVTDLAERIGVSDTTIINLCSDLGFSGFASFKRAVREELQQEKAPQIPVAATGSSAGSNISVILPHLLHAMEETFTDSANIAALEEGAKLMAEARKVYAVGFWTNAAHAIEFCINLRRRGWAAEAVYPSMGDYIDKILQITSDDVVVMYDTARYITGMLEISQLLKKQNVPIILITDMGPCPCLPYANVSIHVRGPESGKTAYGPISSTAGYLLRLLAFELRPKTEHDYAKVREGIFSRFNSYGVIEPGSSYTERV